MTDFGLENVGALSGAVMVMVNAEGVRVPGLDTYSGHERHGPIPLDAAGLHLLAVLADNRAPLGQVVEQVAAATESAIPPLVELLEKLNGRGLLVADPATKAPPVALAAVDLSHGEVAIPPGATLGISLPRLLRLAGGGFEIIDHGGMVRARLSPIELLAFAELRQPVTSQQAFEAHVAACRNLALDGPRFRALLTRLATAGVVFRTDSDDLTEAATSQMRRGRPTFGRERAGERDWDRFQRLNAMIRADLDAFEQVEDEERRHGKPRTRVVSVQQNGTVTPLALGTIVGYARAYQGGWLNQHYAFVPDWLVRASKIRGYVREPGVFLFSNYNWSHRHNLTISHKVKQLSPTSVCLHGGPNTPKYEADNEAYFRDHPDVDITVRGEGEQTVAEILAALAGRFGDKPVDLSVLHDVPGLSFRYQGKVVRTPDRPRITDLDTIPSPLLTGLFDMYSGTSLGILETNRGCPYSCAFCDWGSATNQKIRQFSIERVFAELEWFAKHRVAGVMCADANFGVFERDVAIAEKVASLKREHGFPNAFSCSFAKNRTTHTKRIIEILAEAGVISMGNIAVQSLDRDTLVTIKRSNIKLEKYEELSTEFRKAGLPLWVDLMFGLPGQTVASFHNDLQGCINRGVFPRMFMTELLVNSPMNEPSYREAHKIKTASSPDGSKQLVIASATFTEQEYADMNRLRLLFMLGDVIGMLRHVAHWVRSETGVREIDFYERLRRELGDEPERWPVLTFALRAVPGVLVPPASWALVVEETRRYLVEVLGLAPSTEMDTVLAVQLAVLPARDRDIPERLELRHDYAAWHGAMVQATHAGHHDDWHTRVPRLGAYGPASFVVDDPHRICDMGIGAGVDGDLYGNFELRSAVARWTRPADRSKLPVIANA